MRIAGLFAAETAAVVNDRLDVTGALWDGLQTTSWPAGHRVQAVALLRPDKGDVGVKYHLDFHVTGPNGEKAGHNHCDVVVNVWRAQVPVVLEVPATMAVPGEYELSVRSNVGTDAVTFNLVGPEESPVAKAVEGYALGLDQR